MKVVDLVNEMINENIGNEELMVELKNKILAEIEELRFWLINGYSRECREWNREDYESLILSLNFINLVWDVE